jgi:hypothetical protein
MARIKEKVKVEKVVSTVWNWVAFGVLAAVVVAGIVLGIIALVDHFGKDDNKEKVYEEIYESEKLHITLSDLEKIIDNNQHSELVSDMVYVYVYSSNIDDYKYTQDSDYVKTDLWVKACIEAFETAERNSTVAFYLVNIELEENKEYMETNTTVAGQALSQFRDPVLLEINTATNGSCKPINAKEEGDIIEALAYSYEALLGTAAKDEKVTEIDNKLA